jgi:hypothetical protein
VSGPEDINVINISPEETKIINISPEDINVMISEEKIFM